MNNVKPQMQNEIRIVGYEDPDVRKVLSDPLGREEIEWLAYLAEHPENGDPVLMGINPVPMTLKQEEVFLRGLKEESKRARAKEMEAHAHKNGGQATLVVWVP